MVFGNPIRQSEKDGLMPTRKKRVIHPKQEHKDLPDRHIPGLTIKIIAAGAGLLIAGAILYNDIVNEVKANRANDMQTQELIKELNTEIKELNKFQQTQGSVLNAALNEIQSTQRVTDLRITVLENNKQK